MSHHDALWAAHVTYLTLSCLERSLANVDIVARASTVRDEALALFFTQPSSVRVLPKIACSMKANRNCPGTKFHEKTACVLLQIERTFDLDSAVPADILKSHRQLRMPDVHL